MGAASFEYYKHNFTSFSRVTSTLGFFEINTKKVLFFGIIPTSSLWYFSECKHKQKKSCVLDLNDALLRLYLPPKNRNEEKQNKKTMLQIVPPTTQAKI